MHLSGELSTVSKRNGSLSPPEGPQHVIITGASSGIGAALAVVYSAPGRRLSLLARDQTRLDAVAYAARQRGAEVDIYLVDVADPVAMERVLATCDERRPVDLIIANAGIGGRGSLASNSGETGSIARQILTTNVFGVVNTVTPLLSSLVARGRGHIAIMSSLAGLVALPACPAYSASKAAIRSYGAALRALLAATGVKVTIVCPGFVDTPMSASLVFRPPFLWSADRAARYIARGLARGRREIAFPWPLAAGVRILSFLPPAAADRMLMLLRPNE